MSWFQIDQSEPTPSRKLPFLPRFGIVIDCFGHQISYRRAPFLETIVNLIERGPTVANLQRIVMEQVSEINFPLRHRRRLTVNTTARTLSRKVKT